MSLDRIVRWKKRKPTDEEIEFVVGDFFGGAAAFWNTDRWFISLPGKCSHPLVRVDEYVAHTEAGKIPQDRWIEVWRNDKCLYVITRTQDDFVNSLAAGLAEVFARYWQGELT